MPPHTTLHYTMPPNTTNSKSTATTANNATTQMNINNKSTSMPTKASSRQRRATSGSSYVFAPSWLANLNNKSGPSTTVLGSAYTPTTDERSVKEDVKGVGVSKKENRQAKEGLGKDNISSLNRSSSNGMSALSSTRSKSRDLSGSRLSAFGETEYQESPIKVHGRSRSVSQVNQPISSNFDKNFPTLAKKKQLNLSVDLPTKNVENIWANSDAKSKVLSPTSTTPSAEEPTKFNIPNIENEPELERRMSLVPKVESGKRVKHSMKRKTNRSLSVDSVARGPNGSSVFGFGVGSGIPNGRSFGQTQNSRSYLRENVATKPIGVQPQRQRAASISTSNGIKKTSAASRIGGFGQSTITGRKLSTGGNSKYLWSNTTMGKIGCFKIFPEEEEDDEHLNDRKEDNNSCDHIEEEEDEGEVENRDVSIKDNSHDENVSAMDSENVSDSSSSSSASSSSISSSIEREEKFLLQLGWQKPYNKDADSSKWAITEEEKRFFVNLVRSLNGISVSGKNETKIRELSYYEINCAKKKWATLVKNKKNINGDKFFVTKRVTFNNENGRNNY